MKGKKVGILIGVAAAVVAVGASVTVTQQNEYKLIRQFGKVDRVISSSGISFKIPFIESMLRIRRSQRSVCSMRQWKMCCRE